MIFSVIKLTVITYVFFGENFMIIPTIIFLHCPQIEQSSPEEITASIVAEHPLALPFSPELRSKIAVEDEGGGERPQWRITGLKAEASVPVVSWWFGFGRR